MSEARGEGRPSEGGARRGRGDVRRSSPSVALSDQVQGVSTALGAHGELHRSGVRVR